MATESTTGTIWGSCNRKDPAETLLEAQEKGIAPDLLNTQQQTITAGSSGIGLFLLAVVAGGYFLFQKDDGPAKKVSLNGTGTPKSQKHLKINL
jgi:hypothetical protein